MLSTAAPGAIRIPVDPPDDKGAIASARHWLWSSLAKAGAVGKDASAAPLVRTAASPAAFQ